MKAKETVCSEIKRLTMENKAMKQRVTCLESECGQLADRLIKGQVSKAEGEETAFAAQRELSLLKRSYLETSHLLENAKEEVKILSKPYQLSGTDSGDGSSDSSRQSSLEEQTPRERLAAKSEATRKMQEELLDLRLKEAENEDTIRKFRDRVKDLEEEGRTLRAGSAPNSSVARMQEELIAVKTREAEANASLTELRNTVNDITSCWQKHLQFKKITATNTPNSTPKKISKMLQHWTNPEHQRLEEELITSRLKAAETTSELKGLRKKAAELQSQVHVSANHMKRQDGECKRMGEQLEEYEGKLEGLRAEISKYQKLCQDLNDRMRDELQAAREREMQNTREIVELIEKISALSARNEISESHLLKNGK